jgi:hypothetical protein
MNSSVGPWLPSISIDPFRHRVRWYGGRFARSSGRSIKSESGRLFGMLTTGWLTECDEAGVNVLADSEGSTSVQESSPTLLVTGAESDVSNVASMFD